MLVLVVSLGILVSGVLVGVVVMSRGAVEEQADIVNTNADNYGTTVEAVNDSKGSAKVKVQTIIDNDDLEEAMLCSDVEIEKAEAAIMKHLDETLDINEMDKYFGVADGTDEQGSC